MALRNRFERIGRGAVNMPPGPDPFDPGAAAGAVRFLSVSPALVEPDPAQPRKDLGDLEGLRASIRAQGILQPLIVSPLDERRYRLIAGERRLMAARRLGLAEVPVLVRGVEEHTRLVLQIVENLHRKDLAPLEEAGGVRRLLDESGLGQREVAARLGKSLTYVNELVRLLDLPGDVLEDVRTSEHPPSKSVLLEIARQPDENGRRRLWERVRSGGGLTVQEARLGKRAAGDPARSVVPGGHETPRPDSAATAPAAPTPYWSVATGVGLVSVRLKRKDRNNTPLIRRALREALAFLDSLAGQ